MRYRNRITGNELETECLIAGEDWEALETENGGTPRTPSLAERPGEKPSAKNPTGKTKKAGERCSPVQTRKKVQREPKEAGA